MADKIRWGVISTANIGRKRVLPAIQQSRNGELVAIASRNLDSAQAVADELGIPKAYGSYEALIADPDIDAIYNPLPNSLHAEWSIKCAEAGKPTLCEKPLASDAAEAQTMVDAFAERGVLFAEAFMWRFHPRSQRVKQMLDDGAVGDVHVISATFSFRLSDESNIRLSKALAGGSLMDVGCYCINAARFFTGEEPIDGQAFADWGATTGVEERLTAILRFESGVIAHFDSSLRSQKTHQYEIRGSKGRILVEDSFVPEASVETVIRYWHEGSYEAIKIDPANHYQIMVEDFADALSNNRPPKFLPQDGVNNMKVIDMLLAKARE
ncbi:MAG: gfo/Idh/MocA family oxidoreductase [Chloroflexi bacterium]|nr:MAG: gfo/Idh/MocA family oxidoreductase [Chloroflexota bacterium]